MRAVWLRRFGSVLDVSEAAVPPVGPGEALVRVRAVGLCGTDLKLIDGLLGPSVRLPVIPGHEIAGELARPAGQLAAGTRVACYIYDTCGHCGYCEGGRSTLCDTATRLGIERPGGLAEFVAVPADQLLVFSEDLSFERAAVTMDSVATSWRALLGSGAVKSGETVLVVGAGGLGLSAIQIAATHGARVAALDISAASRDRALRLGAQHAVDPDDAGEIIDWSSGGVDVALEVSGTADGFVAAVACVGRGGRVVCCGYRPGHDFPLDSTSLVLREISITGSRHASVLDARAALAAVERGDVVPAISGCLPLEEVGLGIDRLRSGAAVGRIVIIV